MLTDTLIQSHMEISILTYIHTHTHLHSHTAHSLTHTHTRVHTYMYSHKHEDLKGKALHITLVGRKNNLIYDNF